MSNDAAALCALAETIAREAHAGQVDKAGQPYIEHVSRVAGGLDHLLDRAVAWLHDVVEDTAWSREQLDDLAEDMPWDQAITWRNLIADVALLTRVPGQSSEIYYARVRMSPRARRVKLADVRDNADPERLALLDEDTRQRLTNKYGKAWGALDGNRR